jgi:putative hydrolase of the HAD superfamily
MSGGNSMGTLIWDFDGTLGYRAGAWAGALLAALDGLMPGHTLTAEALRPHLGAGFPWHRPEQGREVPLDTDAWWAALHPVFAGAYAACGVRSDLAAACAAAVRTTYLAPDGWRCYDDTRPTLDQLSASCRPSSNGSG